MAGLTKDELKSALISHGVEMNLTAAKKDELVALYEEFVSPHDFQAGEFSSDDENAPLKKVSKKTSRSSKGSKKSKTSSAAIENGSKLTEENSLIVGDIDVNQLTDEELIAYLQHYGIDVGPIVDSTRSLYQRKLAIVMREKCNDDDHVDSTENGQHLNGNNEEKISLAAAAAAEFSADEDINSDEQPSVVVKKSSRNPTPNKSISSKSRTSPLQALGTSLRQRFSGSSSNQVERKEGERFTPTPRRSIHSYKTVETTKTTMTKDGNLVTHDVTYNKETSESTSGTGSSLLAKVLPGIFLLLIVVALAYYVSSKRSA